MQQQQMMANQQQMGHFQRENDDNEATISNSTSISINKERRSGIDNKINS